MLKKIIFALPVLALVGITTFAYAQNSWNGYHWARMANPFTLELGDNVSSAWDGHLLTASQDWSTSPVLDTAVKAGKTTSRSCKPTLGRVEVCNYKYGQNNWLGLTQVWVEDGEHITQAMVQMNDTYFAMSAYNTPAWKQETMCHEVGHALGLDHQDEDFYNANLGTCLDYTTDPSTNQHPNQTDYDTLASVYSHLDSFTTIIASVAGGGKPIKNRSAAPLAVSDDAEDYTHPSAWGKEVKGDAHGHRESVFKRDLGNGVALYTYVTWAE